LRKELKDEAKRRRIESKSTPAHSKDDVKLGNWELTVGIEIHAELNTSRKLFSDAFASTSSEPNSNVALFDLAYPGSQPHFQTATLIPALRAALALNCKIERKSSFDRKHYFYQDQPAGYQITQYYGKFRGHAALILQLLTPPTQSPSPVTAALFSTTTMASHLRMASLSPSESNKFRWSKIQLKLSTNPLPPTYSTSTAYRTL
jgi:aspartyl-tRNA(Asn)/glutamyl-tRNA(Gln) amidotransferase subunit B